MPTNKYGEFGPWTPPWKSMTDIERAYVEGFMSGSSAHGGWATTYTEQRGQEYWRLSRTRKELHSRCPEAEALEHVTDAENMGQKTANEVHAVEEKHWNGTK